jgi:hypothetical protein
MLTDLWAGALKLSTGLASLRDQDDEHRGDDPVRCAAEPDQAGGPMHEVGVGEAADARDPDHQRYHKGSTPPG